MPVESGFRPRPGQEKHAAFKAGLPGNNGVLGSGSGERRGQQGNASNPFTAFINRLAPIGEQTQSEKRGLQLAHPFDPFFLMHKFNLRYDGFQVEEVKFVPTEEQNQMIKHVKLAYGIISHPIIQEWQYRNEIENQVAMDRVYEGNNRVVLTDPEREIFIKIAKAVGIPCDPERKEYFYDEIPRQNLDEEGFIKPKVVDADK